MKPFQNVLIFTVLALAVSAAACAKPPTEEMNAAAEAVTRAENDIDAVTYAGSTLARAKDALARMQAEAAAKRYDTAKSYAGEAQSAALRAIDEGRAGAARARDEAALLVSQLPPLIAETEQGISAAKTADLPLDFDSVDRDFDTACGNADQAQTALSAGRYQESVDRGRTARTGLDDINRRLSDTATATGRKK